MNLAKEYFRMSSTFFLAATLLFCTNRLYRAITSVGLPTLYVLSAAEKLIYAASFAALAAGIAFLWLGFQKSGKMRKIRQ